MSALWFVLVVALVLVTRLAGQAGLLPMSSMRNIGIFGGIVLMIMLVIQCMSASEGARGGSQQCAKGTYDPSGFHDWVVSAGWLGESICEVPGRKTIPNPRLGA